MEDAIATTILLLMIVMSFMLILFWTIIFPVVGMLYMLGYLT